MAKRRHRTAYQQSTAALEREGKRQCYIIYGASGIALYRHWNKKRLAISRLFELTSDIWQDCAASRILHHDRIASEIRIRIRSAEQVLLAGGRDPRRVRFRP